MNFTSNQKMSASKTKTLMKMEGKKNSGRGKKNGEFNFSEIIFFWIICQESYADSNELFSFFLSFITLVVISKSKPLPLCKSILFYFSITLACLRCDRCENFNFEKISHNTSTFFFYQNICKLFIPT